MAGEALLVDADVADLLPLEQAIARGPVSASDLLAKLRAPNSVAVVRRNPLALAHLAYYDFGTQAGYPFTGLLTQVSRLLPEVDGLFTDLTQPRMLAFALQKTTLALPVGLSAAAQLRPVFAHLKEPTLTKYFNLFVPLTAALPVARRVKLVAATPNGYGLIWMSRLGDARTVTANV